MDLEQVLYAYRRPYSWLLQESVVLDNIVLLQRHLDFDMEPQEQRNWCWAATATSVSHFYWTWSLWTQCTLVNAELARNDCCDADLPAECNVPWFLDQALSRTHNFVSVSANPASFETIRTEIDAGHPVGARIGWNGGGGHFMVIYGYGVLGVVQYLNIDDPIYGKVHLSIDDFTNNYQGNGSWTHTYMTKSYSPNIPFKPYEIADLVPKIIWEARPILDQPIARHHKDVEEYQVWRSASLTLAHPVYVIGLDELVEERSDLASTSPVAVRVLESADNQLRAVFDVSGNVEPRVAQMTTSEAYLDKLTRGLEQSLSFLGEQKVGAEDVELRLLRVTALNFEALWLHLDSESADWLVPIISLGALEPFVPIPMDEAQKILRSEAEVIAAMDDAMGA